MSPNRILSGLQAGDLALLEPHLKPISLRVGTKLQAINKRVEHVYFLQSGLACVVSALRGRSPPRIDVGMIGSEGMSGVSVILGDDHRALYETSMIMEGDGHRLAATHLRTAIKASTSLHSSLLLYVHLFMNQMAQSVLANGVSSIEERLARWLLMADDRVEGVLALTHENLADAVGIQRSGMTLAVQKLANDGIIANRRGAIDIVDRKRLEALARGIYVRPISN